jgi:hypothetical protein
MSTGQRFNTLLLGVIVLGITFSSASSRNWKATPTQIASDYSLISHAKSSTETVNIKWWAPPTLAPGSLTGLLEKYVVISVVHLHVNQGGTLSFDEVKALEASDSSGKPLTLVSRSELPPVFIGFLSTLEAGFRQALGRFGDGTRFFVFDAGTVRACEQGGISVPLAGETYTWETPFPGCSMPNSLDAPKRTSTVPIRAGQAATAAPAESSSTSPIPLAQKAILYEEDTNRPLGLRHVGSAAWHTERVPPAPGQSPDVAITADVEIPDQRVRVQVSFHRNGDQGLPASHTIEIRFRLPTDFPHGGIANIPGLLMKQEETARGVPLAARAAKVDANFFIVGLSSVDTDMRRNIPLLKERSWLDIPIVYDDGKRVIIAIEKGLSGERVFSDAFAAWDNAPPAASEQTNR